MEYKLTKRIGKRTEEINFRMPNDWSELSFKQLRSVYELILNQDENDLNLISILSGLDSDLLRYCEADEMYIKLKLDLADFSDNLPNLENLPLPETVKIDSKLYVVVNDIGHLPIEILEYCRIKLLQYNQIPEEERSVLDLLDLMLKIYAHYAYYIVNKKYASTDVNLDKDFQSIIANCLWSDVVGFASFFLRKSQELMNGTKATLSLLNIRKTKSKRGLFGLVNVGALRWLLRNFLDIMLLWKKNY
jgi:hypothetical protein